jgi:hypothetical protein
MNTGNANETQEREARAFEEARSLTPEHTGSKNVFGRAARMEPAEDDPDADETQETQRDADESPRAMQDFITVEHARPDLPSETPDGLNELEEEVRHQAEDRDLGWA